MKKYSTTLLNGFILGISTMLFIGAKSQDKNLGDITVNSISVVDGNNEIKALIDIQDNGDAVISMKSTKGYTSINGGAIGTSNSKGNELIYMGSDSGGGLITTSNSKGNSVVGFGSDRDNGDGFIQLNDRYGDVGWVKTGKR